MNPTDPHDLITRWVDGAMNPAERTAFEAELERSPTLRAEAEAAKAVGPLLRGHVALESAVPHGDYFNSQIQERIAELRRAERQTQATPTLLAALSWAMRRWWLLTAAAAAVAVSLVLWHPFTAETSSRVLGFYTPNPNVQARSYEDSDANAAVLMLDGLTAIPDDHPISGIKVQRTVNEPETASTTLYDEKDSVLLAMAADAAGAPHVMP